MKTRTCDFARRSCGCILLALLAGPLAAADLTLRVSSETVPAGGWAQIKISSPTPQRVAIGRILMKFDSAVFGSIADVAVFSAQGDAVGVANVSGQSLDVTFSSKAAGIAQLPGLPLLTVTVPVLGSAPAGTVSAITLDAGRLIWGDAQNRTYSITVIPGSVTIGGSLSIRDATPGGGPLATGTPVRIRGTGFSAATTVNIDGVSLSRVQFVSAGELDLILGGAADLTGKRLLLRNPDGEQAEYFSAVSSIPDQAPANLASVRPLLSMQTLTGASFQFTIRGGSIALRNPNPTPVDVILQSQGSFSPLDSQTTVTVPPGALAVYSNGGGEETGFLAFAPLPMQMLGLAFPPPNSGILPVAPFPASPPVKQLAASPTAVAFQWQLGSAAPAPVSISLRSTLNTFTYFSFQVESPAAPFSVSAPRLVSPATLTITVSPAGLAAGTYTASLSVTPEGPNAIATTIPLSLTVSAAPLLVVTPASLTFPGDLSQTLKVESNGSPLTFTAAAADSASPHWLTVTSSGGTTPATLTVTTSSANLSPGLYQGQVAITAANNTVTVPVQLSVAPSNTFSFSPPSATFSVQAGSPAPPTQTVLVYGPSEGAAFSAATASGGNWLSVIVTPTGQLGAVIKVDPAGLKAGTYTGTVTLTSPASPLPATLPVTLVVWDQAPVLTVAPSQVTYNLALGDNPNVPAPQEIRVESGGVPLNFTANFPQVPASGGLLTTPATVPAPASGITSLGASEYGITLVAGTQQLVVPVTTIVGTSPQAPPFLGSVVNAASQLAGAVAPGEILTIFGFGVGPSNPAGFTLDPAGKVATGLNGAQVLFDGRPAPLIYGSPFQANVIVPYEVAGQAATTIAIQSGSLKSAAWTMPVALTAPGIFTLGSSGVGAGAVLNQDNSLNAVDNPAAPGSVVQIYATGEGQTSPAGVTGAVAGSQAQTPLQTVKVTIGGQDATVQYSGSSAGSVASLLQINAVVPAGVTPGAADLRISVGGVLSQAGVTIAVR